MFTPKLGHISANSKGIRISPSAMNQHILISGKSGSGKSVAIHKIEKGIVKQGGRVLVLNFNGTHDRLREENCVNFINVRTEGIPLSLLSPLIYPDGREEDKNDVCEAIVNIFSCVRKLGSAQKRILWEACNKAIEKRMYYENEMECLCNCLIESKDAGQEIVDKYWDFINKVKLISGGTLWQENKITVLDFSGFYSSTQIMLTEMVIGILWHYHRINGHCLEENVWIVCDEFQSLNLKEDSLLSQILREGRKFKLSLMLATQTLSTFDTGCRAILQQAGTKLYFHPSESDIRKIARDIPCMEYSKAQQMLKRLAIGECLAIGEFVIGTGCGERALKLTFQ